MPRHRWWLTAGLLSLLFGCSAPATEPAAAPAAAATLSYGPDVPGITALAYRARSDEATTEQFQVRVRNTGATAFTVVGVALDSPGFLPLPVTPKESVFQPGALFDLRTPYGPVICEPGVAAEPAYAILEVLRDGRGPERVRVPMPSDSETVSRMHAEDCAARQIADAVTVALSDLAIEPRDGQPVVAGELTLDRADSTESIAVVDLLGSVILQVRPAAGTSLPVTLKAEDSTLAVPIEIRQATCDPHYLSGATQPFRFPLWLSFDGGDEQYSEIPVPAAAQALLRSYLGQVCG
ncbi:MAG: hypothetical protein M3513_07040 [Actinomycetota bacterium]|nr:hypothetical protein [Actinomycetota bacterium]